MKEKIETESIGPENPKIENLLQLKTLLEKEFGIHSFFLTPAIRSLSGYEPPESLSTDITYSFFLNPALRPLSGYKLSESLSTKDIEKERRLEKMALENTKINLNMIQKLNNVLAHYAKIMEQEMEWAKQTNEKRYLRESQEIFSLFKDKKIGLNDDGTIKFYISEN